MYAAYLVVMSTQHAESQGVSPISFFRPRLIIFLIVTIPLLIRVFFTSPLILHHATDTEEHGVSETAQHFEHAGVSLAAEDGSRSSTPLLSTALPCTKLPVAEDVLVVMKMDTVDAIQKLSAHFDTTFRCIPHLVVYSDFEEFITSHDIRDTLDGTIDHIKQTNSDSELYENLREFGKMAIPPSERSGGFHDAGWRLDKWKFSPLIDKALRHRPRAKWFVFIEADTYLVWSNLLRYISHFNHTKPYYIGLPTPISELAFAHARSSYIISSRAVRVASKRRPGPLAELDRYTADAWAGDRVLGNALRDIDAPILSASPHVQNSGPSALNYDAVGWSKRLWCSPVVSYRHVSSEELTALWHFEQRWINSTTSLLRHSDVFKNYILPNIVPRRDNWDNTLLNGEDDNHETQTNQQAASFEDCRFLCTSQGDCVQYAYSSSSNRCVTSATIRLGRANSTYPGGIRSGWVTERIQEFAFRNVEACGDEEEWVL